MNSEGHPTERGPSIIALIERELDIAYAEFIGHEDETARLSAQGRATGLATALAILKNPYAPNLRAEKNAARERYNDA
jgi:hypothetical protein